MVRFFISYSRADRLFIDLLLPLLLPVYGNDCVWFDEQITGGADWWKLILEEVSKCHIFLMLISNESLTSSYCQDECREAIRLQKLILPIIVRPKTDTWENIAEDIKQTLQKINYIDLSQGFTQTKAVTSFYSSINKLIERTNPSVSANHSDAPLANDVNGAIASFFTEYSKNNWLAAKKALRIVRKFKNIPVFFDVDEYTDLLRQHEAMDQQYKALHIMAQYEAPSRVWEAIQKFQTQYPDYDPEKIFDDFHPDNKKYKQIEIIDILPKPFEWCEIPNGSVTVTDASSFNPPGSIGGQFDVAHFAISKYPVTNAQFQAFIEAQDGYQNDVWWIYSSEAKNWHINNPVPKNTAFVGDDFPRTNVCWFEAVAFCNWISTKSAQIITLPTEEQWQHAAQGNNELTYPWGNEFDQKLCNSKSRGVSPVTYYKDVPSPYGVSDLVGNVLEWCLNNWASGDINIEHGSRRVLRGGSWHRTSNEELMSDYRTWNSADFRSDNRGFRIVKA